jgi:hypothetical protein
MASIRRRAKAVRHKRIVGASATAETSVDLRRRQAQTDPLEGCIFYGMGDDLVFRICEHSGRCGAIRGLPSENDTAGFELPIRKT